jgi:hypothetical protein
MPLDQRLLIDNDAFVIFAGTDLLADVLDVLGYVPAQAVRLAALPHMLGKSKSMKGRYPADVLTKAGVACSQITALEDPGDPETLQRLIMAHDDINDGEALLLAVAAKNDGYAVLTGDRRALVAFGQAAGIDDLRAALADRLVCLEIALRLLAEKLGVTELVSRLAPLIPIHQTMKIFFSPACQADHSQCFAAMKSYFIQLRVEVGVTLLANPFTDLK